MNSCNGKAFEVVLGSLVCWVVRQDFYWGMFLRGD